MHVVLFGVTLIIFSMIHLVPGDPAFLILGERATDQKAADLRHQLGLDQSLPMQYWHFISGIAHGNFGNSLLYRQPVNSLVFRRIPVTLFLAVLATILEGAGGWAAHSLALLSDAGHMLADAGAIALSLICLLWVLGYVRRRSKKRY